MVRPVGPNNNIRDNFQTIAYFSRNIKKGCTLKKNSIKISNLQNFSFKSFFFWQNRVPVGHSVGARFRRKCLNEKI